ncbi:MAG TPA: DUF393 domain-containing protein [Thermoanaerobaculia bacterium]
MTSPRQGPGPRRLDVLYDSRCGVCSSLRAWAMRQPQYVPMRFVPAGTALAARLYPALAASAEELVVVDDAGGVYRDARAWILCLWALVRYREWALRLARPSLMPFARKAYQALSKRRHRLSYLLHIPDDAKLGHELNWIDHDEGCRVILPSAAGGNA